MAERSEPHARLEVPAFRRRLLSVWRNLRFGDVVLATILPILAVVLLFGLAVYDYARTRHFDDWWTASQSVTHSFRARAQALRHLPATLALRHQFDPDGDAGHIRLIVEGREWDAMQSDPLAMWGEWVDATLEYGSTSIDARIRKRGDNSIHWLTDKRTLTVRTPRDEFYKRFRGFGLSVKDVVPAYLANRLGSEFGILSPATEVVPVYLNNKFFGTYRFLELPDESFLRPYDRMPGNIFRADRAERGEYYKGLQRTVFQNPTLWDRTAMNDRWTSAGPGQLQLLLEDVNGLTFTDHERLRNRIDTAEFARLFTYLFIVGDPYHMDQLHNQLLYEDPSTQRLHPIPWDLRLLDLGRPQYVLNDLFQAVLRDPYIVDATAREIGRRVADDAVLEVADSLLRDVDRRYGAYLEYDRGRAGLVPSVGSSEASLAMLRRNVALLRNWISDDTVAAHAARAGSLVVMDFETRGRVGTDLVAFDVPASGATRATVRLDYNRNGVLDASDPAIPARLNGPADRPRLTIAEPVALLAAWNTEGIGVHPGRMPYRIFIEGLPGDGLPAPVLINRVTRTTAAIVPWQANDLVAPGTGWHPWMYPKRTGRAIRLAGTVTLDSTMIVPFGDTLVIEPGTTIRLAPDVSIVSRGLVIAEGTESRPIRFLPQQAGAPWGSFSLQEHGTDGSVVRWAEFAEGGGALVQRIEYIGMVNVHRARGVVFDRITFRDNLRSDDTFHALHAHVDITNSRFIRANSDAVDYDISSGDIRGNTFDGSGGDAIDLMTSTPRIIGNTIRGSGDKGVSVGEASRPLVFDNLIVDGAIGIEVKDRSEPLILNNEIAGNRIGLRERRKNWRYGGGGWATVINTVFRDNRVPRERDTLSRLTAHGARGLGDSIPDGRADDLRWLYQAQGLNGAQLDAPGRPDAWTSAPPVPPIAVMRFVDDFGPLADGWTSSGGITRLEKRRDALRLHVQGRRGDAGRAVDWALGRSGTLVLEVASRDLANATAIVYGATDSVTVPLPTGDDLTSFSLIAVPLPAGQFDRVRIVIEPRKGLSHSQSPDGLYVLRAGRLELRSIAVYAGTDDRPSSNSPELP
jgi:parallel beta-helix repeat protein